MPHNVRYQYQSISLAPAQPQVNKSVPKRGSFEYRMLMGG